MAFEQQPKESDRAFAAFKIYLELGAERSLVRVAETAGKSRTLIERWSRKFDWAARVQAQAAHLATIERQSAEAVAVQQGIDWAKRQEQHREEEWQTRGELIELAREAIARWKRSPARCGTLEGIARMLDLASKLGRLASGLGMEPEEKTPAEDGAFLLQIEVALEKVYGPPRPAVIEVQDVKPKAVQPAAGDAA